MEVKAKLDKPYSDKQRADFIVQYNRNFDYEIRETETALEAWGLTAEEQAEKDLQDKKDKVYTIREDYFIKYVDWYQSKPLLWEEMTEKEKTDVANYRIYLKDYTLEEDWWERQPLTFDEWKKFQEKYNDTI
jgi:hypothetical protein